MSSSTTADWLALTRLLNHLAYRQPPVDHWLHSFFEALSERIPTITGLQVIMVVDSVTVTQAASGQAPAIANASPTFDAGSPVMRALNTRERQTTNELAVYPLLQGDEAIGALIVNITNLVPAIDDVLSMIAAQLGPVLSQQTGHSHSAPLEQLIELNRQIGSSSSAGDMATLVLETTQGIGRAINARRVRVRFVPPGEESTG